MIAEKKIRSEYNYCHYFPNGDAIMTSVSKEGKWIDVMRNRKTLLDTDVLSVSVIMYSRQSVASIPVIGAVTSLMPRETKKLTMTYKKYKDFIRNFWLTGPEYFNQI